MKICIPIESNKGLKSKINAHFGSAPYFLIYEPDEKTYEIIDNDDKHHTHGMCQPIKALDGKNIDAIICKGMGVRAVQKLNRNGVWAYKAIGETAEEVITACKKGDLKAITINNACNDHNCMS